MKIYSALLVKTFSCLKAVLLLDINRITVLNRWISFQLAAIWRFLEFLQQITLATLLSTDILFIGSFL